MDPEGRYGAKASDAVEGVVVTGSRVRPAVALNVSPPPIQQDARITAVFRIGR